MPVSQINLRAAVAGGSENLVAESKANEKGNSSQSVKYHVDFIIKFTCYQINSVQLARLFNI